jgi:hypothetical protein
MAYWAILLVFAFIAATNGQSRIWLTSVTDADFSARGAGAGAGGVGGVPYPQGGAVYPPPQQPQQPMMTGPAPSLGVTGGVGVTGVPNPQAGVAYLPPQQQQTSGSPMAYV